MKRAEGRWTLSVALSALVICSAVGCDDDEDAGGEPTGGVGGDVGGAGGVGGDVGGAGGDIGGAGGDIGGAGGDVGGAGGDVGGAGGHTEDLSFESEAVEAATGQADDGTHLWLISAEGGDMLLSVEVYEAFGGPTAPGEISLKAAETDYATCGTCVLLQTGCAPHDDHWHCAQTWMPTVGGVVRFDALPTAVGETIRGGLEGVTFQAVEIAEDYSTTPIEGVAPMGLAPWSFEAELGALAGEAECGGHGHLHGDQCHCDAGYVVDPDDATLCVPEV